MSRMDIDGLLPVGFGANPKPCRRIPTGEIDNALLLTGLRLWEDLRGGRRYPPRAAVTPRFLKPILRNTSLLKVLEGGTDYEYRIVGDAYVMAHGRSFQGLRLSETGRIAPGFSDFARPIYDRVVQEGEPLAMRGWMERGGSPTNLIYAEYLYLPLGGAEVDYILIVAVYLQQGGFDHRSASNSFTV